MSEKNDEAIMAVMGSVVNSMRDMAGVMRNLEDGIARNADNLERMRAAVQGILGLQGEIMKILVEVNSRLQALGEPPE